MVTDPKEVDFEYFQQDALFSYEEELMAQEYEDLALAQECPMYMGEENLQGEMS